MKDTAMTKKFFTTVAVLMLVFTLVLQMSPQCYANRGKVVSEIFKAIFNSAAGRVGDAVSKDASRRGLTQACPECGGEGEDKDYPGYACYRCNGAGWTLRFFPLLIALSACASVAFWGVMSISKESEQKILPSLTSSHAIDEHAKINFWLHFYLIVSWFLTIVGLFFIAAGLLGFLTFLLAIAGLVAFFHVTLRLWKVIPPVIARCTPEKAAWFSLIPIFNFYWWFIAFRGLAEDMNKTASRYGNSALISLEFATAACIVWVIYIGIALILPELYESLYWFFDVAHIGVTTAFFIQLRNACTTLLILKTSPSPVGNTPNP
jgi:hypothetical protein